ncbi:hypothetical protein LEP1GSC137_0151 [Leptospira borgpetersenii str. Noumea 25]|uniref:Uncharacterized protein n=1 Tax=Leptospira borgpetersenii serovar Ballum TaxID=280505 RepID=A0A0S2IXJ8_LEPBO|nr:hypothetical protein LBBP_04205 [Leptospira borgpetersenii serovar Ballum]EKR00987.1 hypothetical protein LEP1GSC121_1455 [Leptospira borgpetersenii serovar Castellonis str. 200801910]EMO09986.1 hypothetical protein LEP1GSC137_0151 [Leptospira borgpetersenii str. Noumea 25]
MNVTLIFFGASLIFSSICFRFNSTKSETFKIRFTSLLYRSEAKPHKLLYSFLLVNVSL